MKRWVLGLVGAVLALALAVPLLLKTIEQASCGGSPLGSIGPGTVGRQPASGGFSAENVTIAKAAAVEAAARRLPARALVVILATGFQESGVRNLDYGDRDSVGWLQQRAGWGSVSERMNPQTAAGKFYDHLVRVPGWESLPITVAAQRVQISAYPDAYAKWQAKAEQLAAIVSGGNGGTAASPATSTTARAAIVAYAKQVGARSTPHLDPEGLPAFDLMSRGDLDSKIAEEVRTHHEAYGARYVISQMRIASSRSDWAWLPYSPITGSGDFQHTGHVHISYTDGPVSGALAGDAGAGQVGCDPGSMPAAKVITWNSFHGRKYPDQRHGNDQRVVNGMLELAKSGDIIGAQELSDSNRKAAVNKAMDGADWAFVATHTAQPIYFNRKVFTLVSDDTTTVYERGDSIEGNDQGDRYIVTAVLRSNATGQLLTVINMHQLPHIQKHGVLNKKQPKRIAMAIAAWREMGAAVARHKQDSAVVVVGDMNYDGDPRGMYAAAGLTMASKVFGAQHTLRKREIDQILFTAGMPISQQTLGRYGSDHAARMVTFAASTGAAGTGGGPVPATFNQQANPRTVEQAVAWMQANMPRGAPGEPVLNACERYMNLAYGLGGGYPTALSHWNAAGPKSRGYSTPPRGALVFWRSSNPAGHVALSLGNGIVVSTDYNAQTHRYQAGMLSAGPITDIDRWGERLGWRAPNFRVGSESV